MILMLLVVAAVAYYYAGGYAAKVSAMKTEAVSLVSHSSKDTFRKNQTSIAYDVNGTTLSVLKGEKDVYYIEYEDIPVYIKQAIISTEDKRFYKHKGIDYRGIMRAIIAMIQDGEVTQGGSTITQQLARTVFLSNEKTWERKIEEMYIAVELEKKYTKEDILEFYLNNVYFANGYYGIEAAAQGYFGTDVSHLSLSQMIYLCAIPNNPTLYNPLTNPDKTEARRDRILKSMLEDKVISENSYETAKAEKIETVAQFDEIFRPYCPEGYGWTTREIAMNWFMNDGLSAFVDLTTGTANFTQARFYEILDFCRQFPVEFEAATAEQMFRTIELYEPLCILREYEHYERLNGDEPGVTIQPLPFSAQDGYGVRGESYLAITSGCQNNAAAELLLREAFSLPMQKRACVQYKAGSEEDVDVVWCIPVRKVLCDILWRYSDADVPSELSEEELGPWKADIEETNKAYDELLAMIARADHFEGGGDRTLYEIVTEEAARFFDGACTEEEAAQAIDRRAELYLMEQR